MLMRADKWTVIHHDAMIAIVDYGAPSLSRCPTYRAHYIGPVPEFDGTFTYTYTLNYEAMAMMRTGPWGRFTTLLIGKGCSTFVRHAPRKQGLWAALNSPG